MWRNVAPLQPHRDGKCTFLAHGCHISVRIGTLRGCQVSSRVSYTPLSRSFYPSRAGGCLGEGLDEIVPAYLSVV